MSPRQVSLSVNDTPIELNYFVEGFIAQVVGGTIASMKDTGRIQSVNLSIKGDAVKINLNNAPVPINPFASKTIRNTIVGMVSSLKQVSEIDRLEISIRR